MEKCELAIVGGGPAGLAAALKARELGLKEIFLLERDNFLGGQLVKQTHQFFGSHKQFAGIRGIDIAEIFKDKLEDQPEIQALKGAVAQGYYEDDVLGYSYRGKFFKLKPEKTILATGASEKMLSFPNNDLPGIYGAGAVQTLMNQYGIIPGEKILMIGAGNIGLIVAYQLLQAGIEVEAVIEATGIIGGYAVHASKIRRAGIPILTYHTIKEARGDEEVESAVIQKLNENWQPVPGTEQEMEIDTICLAVGLTPKVDLAIQAGCQMAYVAELGGDVPVRDENLQTSNSRVYIAGDSAGIEEATAAILEGELAAASAAGEIFPGNSAIAQERREIKEKLADLRRGPVGEHIRRGLARVRRNQNAGRDRYTRSWKN